MRDSTRTTLVRRTATAGIATALALGLVGSADAVSPGPSQLPVAMTGTVKDICTGAPIPGAAVSITDAAGTALTPSKRTDRSFTFAWFASSSAALHVSAAGYEALGDPAAPDPGLVFRPPTGPFTFVGGGRVTERLTMAAMLTPTGGCATPIEGRPAIVKGTLHDSETHAVVDAPVGYDYRDIATGQSQGKRRHGTITITRDPSDPGVFDADVPGYRPLTNIFVQPEPQYAGAAVGGALTIGQLFDISVQPAIVDKPPVIQFLDIFGGTSAAVNESKTLEAVAYDPEGLAITVQWDAGLDASNCTFSDPTDLNSTLTCGNGALGHTVVVRLTVSDPGNHATSATASMSIY